MSKYKYGCEVICNANDVFPAMRDLVEKEGMSIHDAALFIEKDSKGEVSKSRAYQVYTRRVEKKKSAGTNTHQDSFIGPVSDSSDNFKDILMWKKDMEKQLIFASDILEKKVVLKDSDSRFAIKDCFGIIDEFIRLYIKKRKNKDLPF